MLRSCDDLDFDNFGDVTQCIAVLNQYQCYRILGYGEFGVALQVMHSESTMPVVVKILLDKDEVETACLVEKRISRHDSNFARFYGWLACHGSSIPLQWKTMLQAEHAALFKEDCYFIVMEYGNGVPLRNYVFESIDEFRYFIYELIASLKRANETVGFVHEDLHTGNVLYLPGPFKPRNYNGTVITAPCRPMIIDFGASAFEDEPNRVPLSDVNTLVFHLLHRRNQDPLVLDWIKKFYSAVFTPVTNSFQTALDYLQVETVPMQIKSDICFTCGDTATHQYKHAAHWKFCGKRACVKRMGPIASILP